MKEVVYFKVFDDEEQYVRNQLQNKNNVLKKILNRLIHIKFRIISKFNFILKINDELIIFNRKGNERNVLERINKKIKSLISQNENIGIILSNQIKYMATKNQYNEKIEFIYQIINSFENSKLIYNQFINVIIKTVISKYEIPEQQSIFLLIKRNRTEYLGLINDMIKNYKVLNIVTDNVNEFKQIEKRAEQEFESISILNNKRKSIAKAKYIINVDFSEEELKNYFINRNAIIFNINNEKLKKLNNFDGIVINNVKIFEKDAEYSIKDEYIANNKKSEEIHNMIENNEYELIGNNGKIQV